MAILVAALIACAFWKFDSNNYTRPTVNQEWSDTIIVHDTIVDVHAIIKTVHDTIYITD